MVAHRTFAEDVVERGFTFLRGFLPSASTLQAITEVGVIDVVEGLAQIQTLVPTAISHATPNTYSGNFGMGAFPLHTDLAHWGVPPRFLALRCVNGSAAIPTRVLDGRVLIDKFGLTNLRCCLVQSRRPIQNRKQLLPLCERISDGPAHRLRWDSIYLRPASQAASTILEQISAYLATVQVVEIRLVELGDTLIIDNWRCLHGRGTVPELSEARKIQRAYLKSIT